ncbi:unnamed protein product [Durusdinium trenchii]|uniref:Uncharacterized protein n=1 Tax=Durusdinium trenchii TaxID=1381693 RepID=A0ABP0LE85_9DINO
MPIDLELLQKIERQRQRLEDGLRAPGVEASPAKKEGASFAATTPPSSEELSSSFVTPSSRSSGSTPELGSYRLVEGRCEAVQRISALDLEEKEQQPEMLEEEENEKDMLRMTLQRLWQASEPEASLAATAQIRLGNACARSVSRDLSPVDETKVMAWRPQPSPKGPAGRRRRQDKQGVSNPRSLPTSAPKKAEVPSSRHGGAVKGQKAPSGTSTELQLRRLGKELAAEGQRFRQQGKLCFELAVRAEALHSEVRVQQQHAAREREAQRATGRLCQGNVISAWPKKEMTTSCECDG